MTKQEFEQWWADGAGLTVEQVRDGGFVPMPCDCEDEVCRGWRMQVDLSVLKRTQGDRPND